MVYRILQKIIIMGAIGFLLLLMNPGVVVQAQDTKTVESAESEKQEVKKYGIMIQNSNGTYAWYDLNDSNQKSAIEITKEGYVMLPAWKMASYMDEITYTYNKTTQQLTLKNKSNGRKLICKKNSKTASYYASASARAVKKTMKYQMYVSKKGVMISADAFKWIMNASNGYKYYNQDAVCGLGYDAVTYSAILVYSPSKPIKNLVKATSVTNIPNTIKVTIPEGYSVAQTFELLVKKGVCSSIDDLFKQCNEYPYESYRPLVAAIPASETHCFRLEGYLYPDTYEFYRLCSAQDAIGKFLRNGEAKITEELQSRADELGLSMYEVITIASIIEKETGDHSQMKNISAVIHNRLNVKMRLQVDATSYYVDRYLKPYISGDTDRYSAFYNTYKCSALPAGPICSPSLTAIKAALDPADSEAVFFCSDEEGNYYYSKTYEEHLAILEKIKNPE